jgi:hypothetical protein
MKRISTLNVQRGGGHYKFIKFLTPIFVLTLLAGGGFLILQNQNTAKAADTFTEVFTDNFNRTNTTTTQGAGNGWVEDTFGSGTPPAYHINNNQLKGEWYSNPLIQPMPLRDGKITAVIHPTGDNILYCLVARYDGSTGYYYGFGVNSMGGGGHIYKVTATGKNCNQGSYIAYPQNMLAPAFPLNGDYTLELIVESISSTANQLTANIKDMDGNTLSTATVIDASGDLTAAGGWGVAGYSAQFDDTTIYRDAREFIALPDAANVKVGTSVAFTVFENMPTSSDSTLDITVDDGDLSNDTLTLNGGNSYEASFTYTPTTAGRHEVTISRSGGASEVFDIIALPYSTAIGFIGDSTSVVDDPPTWTVANLGSGYSEVNMAVPGTSSGAFADPNSSYLQAALTAFTANNVEIVMVRLGANDSGSHLPAATYRANLEALIAELKNIGVKKVILSDQLFIDYTRTANWDAASLDSLAEYRVVNRELVDGETVMLGDVDGYGFFEANPSYLYDGVHLGGGYGGMNAGKLLAAAFDRVIVDPLLIPHSFTGTTADEYTLGGGTGLEYTVDKDLAWFDVAADSFANVLVDDAVVDPSDYTAASGSTEITLSSAYLESLAVDPHTLAVRFMDGVNFTDTFTILAAATNNPGGSNNSNNPSSPFSPTALSSPSTGLFGASATITALISGLMTVITAIGVVLVGRKLLQGTK